MVRQKLRELLSLEYNSNPDDFMKSKNILTVSELHEGRRNYSTERYFFQMMTMGENAVVTADECMQEFLGAYIDGKQGHYLFEIPNLLPIERELNHYGYTLTQTFHKIKLWSTAISHFTVLLFQIIIHGILH